MQPSSLTCSVSTILGSIRYLNSNNKNLCSFHREKWKLIVALMGFSLVTSEAEHFLIWLLSICNLSFVDFLCILFPSLPPALPRTSSKTVLSIYVPDPPRHHGGHGLGRSGPGLNALRQSSVGGTASDSGCEESTTRMFLNCGKTHGTYNLPS